MTDPNSTAIALLVDRSGSMAMIKPSVEAGIDHFVRDQALAPGKRTIRIAQFDNVVDYGVSLPAHEIGHFVLHPRGSTALLDAMAMVIRHFGEELASMDEDQRPGHVVFAIMTDGQENSSHSFSLADVNGAVGHQEKNYGWQFLYLGANQDAIAEGTKLGIRPERSMTYSASAYGTRSVTGLLTDSVAVAAAGGSIAYDDEAREDAIRIK